MRLVIKIAGALLENPETVQKIARQIGELARAGNEMLVIHGGGKIFTGTLERMGISSHFVNRSDDGVPAYPPTSAPLKANPLRPRFSSIGVVMRR